MTAGAASAAPGLGHVLGDASLAGAEESGSRGSRGEEMGGSGGGVPWESHWMVGRCWKYVDDVGIQWNPEMKI